jgi:hypothetical protein
MNPSLSKHQFLMMRPFIEPKAKAAEAPTATEYITAMREFEHTLRFCGWSRTEACHDAGKQFKGGT